jgi:hypothetical protein
MDEKDKNSTPRANGAFVAMGLCLGSAIGVVLDNVALGVAFGLLAGAVFAAIELQRRKK